METMDVMQGRGSEELSLSCESGPDLEASQRDLNIGSAGWRLGGRIHWCCRRLSQIIDSESEVQY